MEDSESQVSFSSLTHENETPVYTKNGYSDRLGAVRTINKTMDGIQKARVRDNGKFGNAIRSN